MKKAIMKVGNSLAVTVPADFAKSVGVRAGDTVEVEKKIENGELVYRFQGVKQLPINGKFLRKQKKRKKK